MLDDDDRGGWIAIFHELVKSMELMLRQIDLLIQVQERGRTLTDDELRRLRENQNTWRRGPARFKQRLASAIMRAKLSIVCFYLCANRSCEHADRAA